MSGKWNSSMGYVMPNFGIPVTYSAVGHLGGTAAMGFLGSPFGVELEKSGK